jgi:hypothetical protein
MIVKLASAASKATGFIPKAIEGLGLGRLSRHLAENPHLVSKLQNASLVPTIALGDGLVKMWNRNPGESKTHAFMHGAGEGALAGGIIGGADQLIDTLAHHGANKLNLLKRVTA